MQQYTDEDISMFRKAGRITGLARDFGLTLIKEGASLLEVSIAVEDKIRSLGGEPAFPAQISLNNIAAHYCASPNDPYRFRKGDVAKLDVGAHLKGYVGDSAATVTVGGPNMLEDASREALRSALEIIKAGVPVNEVGRAIQSSITSMGFKPVSNLSGHAVGIFKVHGEPQVPNVPDGPRISFEKGQVIAIEPFASTGSGLVQEKGKAEIFSVIKRIKVKKGMDEKVLETIAAFNNLPFARRNLEQKHPAKEVNETLKLLLKKRILHSYSPLMENEGVLISQAEHTVYIGDTLEILTKVD